MSRIGELILSLLQTAPRTVGAELLVRSKGALHCTGTHSPLSYSAASVQFELSYMNIFSNLPLLSLSLEYIIYCTCSISTVHYIRVSCLFVTQISAEHHALGCCYLLNFIRTPRFELMLLAQFHQSTTLWAAVTCSISAEHHALNMCNYLLIAVQYFSSDKT